MYDKTWDFLLIECVQRGLTEECKTLIQNGYDVNARNLVGETLLHLTNKPDVAKVLIENGADVNARDPNERTPLHSVYNPDVAKVLLEAGAEVNARDENGKTPLHYTRSDEVVALLLKHGAEVNAQDLDGNTPLHREFGIGLDVAMFLMTNGADAFITNHFGQSPVDVAERYGEWNQQENASVIDAMKAFGEKAVIKRALDQPTPSQIYRDTNEEERRQDASHQDQAFASYEHRNERKRVFRM